MTWQGEEWIRVQAPTEDRAQTALELLERHLARREVQPKAIEAGEVPPKAIEPGEVPPKAIEPGEVPPKAIEPGEVQLADGGAAGGSRRIDVALTAALSEELARTIVEQVEATKPKVAAANLGDRILGDRIRVSRRTRDDLQEVIAMVEAQDHPAPLRVTTYR